MTDPRVAFQMPIEEPELRAYLQRHPFAMGPDDAMNRRCRTAVRQQFRARPERNPVATIRLQPAETVLPADVMARLKELMDQAGIPAEARASMINDFGWEANQLPKGRKDLLAVGCGDGIELLFLRAVFPDANLTGVDYNDGVAPALKKAVGLRFFGGDMNRILEGFEEKFDLVFSNHTLEHLYTPDSILATLSGLLREDGALLSTLPMDGVAGGPFVDRLAEIARAGEIHPVDFVYLDGGHPWKTNPADLDATFKGAGFAKVELYQRAEHLSRYFAGTEEEFHSRKNRGLRLNALIFGNARTVVKMLFPKDPPEILVRALLAADRRTWFGVNTLKNHFAQEACVVAYKQA
jgi:SAM-dependent methyltransferase